MGEAPEVIPDPVDIPSLVAACGGTVHEARLRFVRGSASETRVVVAFPTVAAASRFRSGVTRFGARLEGNPSGLAGGRPLPLGSVVSFSVPASEGAGLLALTP